MAAPTTRESGTMFRLIYSSRSLIEDHDRKTALGAIFTSARTNNRRLGVTGALVVSGDAFVQALEGDEAVVRDLFGDISRDQRHDDVAVIEAVAVPHRTFGRWAMAKVAEDGGPDIRLLSNASAGTIVAVPREDQSITPEQEEVLTFMRESLGQPVADES